MPNWVTNKLTISGPDAEKVMLAITAENENGEREVDFNKILPMPKSLSMASGSITNSSISAYLYKNPELRTDKLVESLNETAFGNFHFYDLDDEKYGELVESYKDCAMSGIKGEQAFLDFGKRLLDNLEQHGHLDWYGWCNANWGTKWNACRSIVDETTTTFDTAWADVRDLICLLSKQYPKNTFEFQWAEEQTGHYVGEATYENGEEISSIDYPDYSKEAYELAFNLRGGEDGYKFNEETQTYDWIDPDAEQKPDGGEM